MHDQLFHEPGLVYFWFLNDRLKPAELQAMIDAFAQAPVAAVCLHPRSGLEFPYGGSDWFELIRWIAERCRQRGLAVWLYDEDPYPSGGAGGRLAMEQPQFIAHRIERDLAAPTLKSGDNFVFEPGKLLWCGLIDAAGRGVLDLTPRVGVLRLQWTVLPQWDSRYYYPQTPLYACPRAWTYGPQLALRVPEHDPSLRLVAFTARPITFTAQQSHWPVKIDALNPQATQAFLQMSHERYAAVLGEQFGKDIRAIFTDEPKWHDAHPYRPELFEDYAQQHGQDLRLRLDHLFSSADHAEAMLTRLWVRQWCCDRFRSAWVQPLARWCQEHQLAFVGHISPEDDPIQQANCVGNLMPLYKDFALPGFDLIIPAVGDDEHPLLNIGVVSATSVRAQADRPGVLSESLACSGEEFTVAEARRILAWQTVMGVTSLVVHGAHQSLEGYRAIDAPPDFGPLSPRWSGMAEVARHLADAQRVLRQGRQVAPVAILWPIRSFMALNLDWLQDESNLRRDLAQLLLACLQRQIGVHLLDEQTLWEARIEGKTLRAGAAAYSHLLVPASLLWHQRSLQMLERFMQAGGFVRGADQPPRWQQTEQGLQPLTMLPWPHEPTAAVIAQLPRLVTLDDEDTDVRCTAWQNDGRMTLLLTHIAQQARTITLGGRPVPLPPGHIHIEPAALL